MINPYSLNLQVAKFSGDEALCLCPFHDDHNPTSFFINLRTGEYICFACGAKGGIEQLAKRTGGTVDNDGSDILLYGTRRYAKFDLNGFLEYPATISQYLLQREVTRDLIKKFDIRSNEHQVIFPFRDMFNRVCGVQVRYTTGNVRYRIFGEKPIWYPFEPINPNKVLFIVEGIFGVIRAYRAGVQAITFIGAKSIPSAFAKKQVLTNHKPVVILFDDDEAGYNGAIHLDHILDGYTYIHVPGAEADELTDGQWQELEVFYEQK